MATIAAELLRGSSSISTSSVGIDFDHRVEPRPGAVDLGNPLEIRGGEFPRGQRAARHLPLELIDRRLGETELCTPWNGRNRGQQHQRMANPSASGAAILPARRRRSRAGTDRRGENRRSACVASRGRAVFEPPERQEKRLAVHKGGAACNSSQNRLPAPRTDSTPISASRRSAARFTIARPMPVPSNSRSGLMRSKMRKMRF